MSPKRKKSIGILFLCIGLSLWTPLYSSWWPFGAPDNAAQQTAQNGQTTSSRNFWSNPFGRLFPLTVQFTHRTQGLDQSIKSLIDKMANIVNNARRADLREMNQKIGLMSNTIKKLGDDLSFITAQLTGSKNLQQFTRNIQNTSENIKTASENLKTSSDTAQITLQNARQAIPRLMKAGIGTALSLSGVLMTYRGVTRTPQIGWGATAAGFISCISGWHLISRQQKHL